MPPDPTRPVPLPVLTWLRAFWPAAQIIDARERWRALVGAGVGMGLTVWLSHWWVEVPGHPWLLAPLGASAVLVFAVPASPLAQPWAVLAGNGVSALVGVACARWVGEPLLAASLAVPLAMALMLRLRCLHPPGGAMALSAVLAHWVGADFPWLALLVNGLVMVAGGVLYNSTTGRSYPHRPQAPALPAHATDNLAAPRFTADDLDAALAQYNQILDVSRDDLETLLQHAEMAAYRRTLGGLACADVMSRNPVSVQFGTGLQEAWDLIHKHRIKALPVVDRVQRIVGIVTLADFMRHAELDRPEQMGQRLRDFLRPTGLLATSKAEVVGQIMTRQVRVVSAQRPLTDLLPLFSDDGHHHIPVVDGEARLVGILTQSDLVRALHRAVGAQNA
ncbi:HPP family protein [uncultured Rhodoferax sp.]|uniref:HPP family protein n=1 Tax=uncultured Rhodoferax sp. TaxID=223188 RepID=UPI0025F892D0|nr:HPP family protein [uncultured Rhodoferax sp.]